MSGSSFLETRAGRAIPLLTSAVVAVLSARSFLEVASPVWLKATSLAFGLAALIVCLAAIRDMLAGSSDAGPGIAEDAESNRSTVRVVVEYAVLIAIATLCYAAATAAGVEASSPFERLVWAGIALLGAVIGLLLVVKLVRGRESRVPPQ